MATNGNALHKLREQIDSLDSELLRLLSQRAQVACEIASIKQASGLPVYDGQREQQILDRLCDLNAGPLDAQAVTSIFRCIIRESRKAEADCMQQRQENSFQQENLNGDQHGGKRI